MLPTNSTLFISDLHLSPTAESLPLFFDFLHHIAPQAHSVYVLGDLFDVWAGEDLNPDFHARIHQAFRAVADRGVTLYFMAGNRDFLVDRAFLKKAKMTLLADPTIIELYGQAFLLSHGDRLCTQDLAYQRYRRIAQHPITKILFRSLPKYIRAKIAHSLRQKSQLYQSHQTNKHPAILDVELSAVLDLMRQYRVQHLVHGHVHRPQIHTVDPTGQRIVLGDWHESAIIGVCTAQIFSLCSFSQGSILKVTQSTAIPGLKNSRPHPA